MSNRQIPYPYELSPYLARRLSMYPPSRAELQKRLVLKMGNPPSKKRPVTYRMLNPHYVMRTPGTFAATQPQLDLHRNPAFKKFGAIAKGWVARARHNRIKGVLKRQRTLRIKTKAYNYSGRGKIKAGFGIRRGTYKPKR